MYDSLAIEKMAIREAGLYILNDGVSCNGVVTSLDICGVFPEIFSPSHFFAAIYRPHFPFNETKQFKRISHSEHIDIRPDQVIFNSGVLCTRVYVNLPVKAGDTIGFSFTTSCVEESVIFDFSTRVETLTICPVYAALNTTLPEDSVYFSKQLDTNASLISSEDLSLEFGVKVNIIAAIG